MDLEGGYVNHPKDPGGETKYGISKRAFPHIYIPDLTPELAAKIYHEHYWGPIYGDALPPRIRLAVFDAAVNQGVGFAIGTAQAVVGAKVDGVIGPKTIAAINACEARTFLKKYFERRLARYRGHPQWGTFGLGWINRLFHVAIENT